MSNTDSFIEEVTEEVKRDRLFALIKKWWWAAALVVILIVGGASVNEWRKAQERASAEAFGDALLASLDEEGGADVLDSLTPESPAQVAIAGHLDAARALTDGDTERGIASLEAVRDNPDVEQIYRELAALKAALAMPADTDAETRIAAFEAITGPLRVLAQEQKAWALAESGQNDEAIALLSSLMEDAEASPGLLRRATEMIVALGGDIGDSDADTQ